MTKVSYKLIPVSGSENIHRGKTLYRPALVPTGEVGLDRIAEIISDKSSQTPADVISTVFAIAHELNTFLCDGYRVDLGPLGKMVQTLRSEKPIYDAQQVRSGNIGFDSVEYRPESGLLCYQLETTFSRDHESEHLKSYSEEERRNNIFEVLENNGTISMRAMRRINHVSAKVAREDLEKLVSEGAIRRISHGNYWLYEAV